MPIQHKRLGAHGALVSNLCLGTMNFGWVTDEAESFSIMIEPSSWASISSTPPTSTAGRSSTA